MRSAWGVVAGFHSCTFSLADILANKGEVCLSFSTHPLIRMVCIVSSVDSCLEITLKQNGQKLLLDKQGTLKFAHLESHVIKKTQTAVHYIIYVKIKLSV